jgi:hypothetical protein
MPRESVQVRAEAWFVNYVRTHFPELDDPDIWVPIW